MSQDNKKSMVMYQGDGSNNVFAVPMTKGKYGTISVAFVRRGLDNYEYSPTTWTLNGGLFAWADTSGNNFYTNTDIPAVGATVYNQYGVDTGYTVSAVNGTTITITDEGSSVLSRNSAGDVDENTLLTWTGDVLNVGDYIVIERTTVRKQPYEFPNNQKHIERSDDNLERQIQEVADAADRALKLDPTYSIDSGKMNPVDWLQTILRSRDLSVRELRFIDGQLCYSTVDPESAEAEKTWTPVPNAFGFTSLRYVEQEVDGIKYRWIEAQKDGAWFPVAESTDVKAQQALDNSETAVSTANDAKAVADGIDAKAQQALDNSETAVSTANDAKAVADGIDAEISNLQNQIDENALDIEALQGAGGALNAYNFNTATPTQETLTKYAVDQIWPGNTNWAWNAANPAASTFTSADGVSRTAAEIFNSTWVNNTYDDHRWQLTNTQNTTPKVFEWADVGRDIVSVATATTAGIVRVGAGSQMVVNPTTGDISLDGTKAESIRGTIGAVATNQGTANAGKILTVGDDGNIELADGASGTSGMGRNVGDIFLSARTNTGTAVNGAVLCNGARYNFSDINQGQNNIQALLNNGSIQSFSMAEYNAAVNSRLYVTPTFLSNSTDGHVVSDARGNSDIYTVFNGVGSKQIGNWSTYWIQEMFPTNVFINSYSITADNKTNAEYPSTWELQGSNNGSSWDSLDLQNNLEFYLGETKTFPVYLSKSYKYYRLVFIDGAESNGNGELGCVHFNVRQSSSIGYFGYDSGASYFKVPNLMDDNATVMLSPSDFETFYHDAFFAGPQSLFFQSTAIPRALSTVILKPYVQLFNGATDDAVATCTQALQQIANIQQTLNGMDYPIYWDADDSGDHSHSKPGVPVPGNHGWYRIYKSGWVEQGGVVSNPNNGCVLVTLPIAMESNSFTALASGNTSGVVANYNAITCERRSSTQIAICTTGQQGNGCSWRVEGYAA